jgi:acylphosphatase
MDMASFTACDRRSDVADKRLAGKALVKKSRMHILYTGKVQGVGFRYTARQAAMGYEVTGIVRNLTDGRVELVAEGAKEELEAFREAIQDSLGHFITQEEVTWEEPENQFRGFEISR